MRPPEPRPSRPPRSVIYRRRLAALLVVAAAVAAAWFAVASIGGSSHTQTHPTVLPPPKPFRVVFPEGFTRDQMAARVAAVAKIAQRERGKTPKLTRAGYAAATGRPRREPGFGSKRLPLEGFLFPATYDFTARTTGAQLAAQQLKAFRREWAKVNLGYARSKNLTPYDILTIGSMIEEEAAAPEERQLIAAVIYNRLHLRMPLGIDATLRYGLHIPPTESIHQSQLESPSPYNTSGLSGHTGLPPTPIGNPGLASLQAAAHPAHVGYLYYVRKPDKIHHFFTASLAAFNAYKAAHGYR